VSYSSVCAGAADDLGRAKCLFAEINGRFNVAAKQPWDNL
jgi:hypothetical protein